MRVHETQQLAGAVQQTAMPAAPRKPFSEALANAKESTRAVAGHDYVEITSGPRNGMFLNTSDNGRRGEAFVRVRRRDHDLHIYGSGKDRRVIRVPHKETGPEITRPVEGHPAYVEITSGPRNGMFINKTSNERSGEAFVLVRKHDRDLHIYGSGKDRRVIVSWHDRKEPDAKPASGGTSAPVE